MDTQIPGLAQRLRANLWAACGMIQQPRIIVHPSLDGVEPVWVEFDVPTVRTLSTQMNVWRRLAKFSIAFASNVQVVVAFWIGAQRAITNGRSSVRVSIWLLSFDFHWWGVVIWVVHLPGMLTWSMWIYPALVCRPSLQWFKLSLGCG